MKKSIYNVNGMTCATCALTVEKAIGKVAGVSKTTVNLATEKVTVEYDEQEVGMKDLQMAVEKAGYELENPYQSQTLAIEGMTCATCALTVEKALNKLDGIQNASVNLATEKATIQYDPAYLSLSEIETAVEKAGYKAVLPKTQESEAQPSGKEQHKNDLCLYASIAVHRYGSNVTRWWITLASYLTPATSFCPSSAHSCITSRICWSCILSKRL